MTALGSGWSATLALLFIAVVVHEPWRWAGLVIGRAIDVESELFQWVRAVATALVSGLVMRLILFPAGELAHLPAWLRIGAFAAGIAGFYAGRRSLGAGIAAGVAALVLGQLLVR